MTEGEILSLLTEFLWAGALISTPLLVSALIAGIAVGLFQALTSIQEMTLTFVPKIMVMLIVFFLSSGFMARVMIAMFDNEVIPMIAR